MGTLVKQNFAHETPGAVLNKYLGRCPHQIEWSGVWGGLSPPQPTRNLGDRRQLPSGVRGRTPAVNTFWRPQNAPFCTYMPMLRVRKTVFHVTFGAKSRFGVKRGNCPRCPNVEPLMRKANDCWHWLRSAHFRKQRYYLVYLMNTTTGF